MRARDSRSSIWICRLFFSFPFSFLRFLVSSGQCSSSSIDILSTVSDHTWLLSKRVKSAREEKEEDEKKKKEKKKKETNGSKSTVPRTKTEWTVTVIQSFGMS